MNFLKVNNIKMKIISGIILLLLPFTTTAQTSSEDLSQLLSNIHTMQADFDQSIKSSKGHIAQKTQGKMLIKRPGLFRWETLHPSRQVLIADGKRVWLYDKDLEQVTVQAQQMKKENNPAMLLVGSVRDLIKNYRVKYLQEQTYMLTPLGNKTLFQSVMLTFKDAILEEMKLIDNLGQTSIIHFSNVKNNPVIPDNLFNFKPPKGVDVVHADG